MSVMNTYFLEVILVKEGHYRDPQVDPDLNHEIVERMWDTDEDEVMEKMKTYMDNEFTVAAWCYDDHGDLIRIMAALN